MDILISYSDNVLTIDISCRNIQGTIHFSRFTKLEKLDCNRNNITRLNGL